jgi:hypothetical protein
LLKGRNRTALREITALEAALQRHPTVPFLTPYRSKLLSFAQQCRQQAESNLDLLNLGIDDLLDDVRSWTALVLENVRVAAQLLAGPLLRSSACDQASIKIIAWLHGSDPRSAPMPPVCSDGDPAVLPLIGFTPLYQFPTLKQESLLHLPLYFHEYGHVLYAIHKPEMDELVKELQDFIVSELQPMSQRNDLRAKRQRELQMAVGITWYAWTQELFCDAVGLLMTGPAYGFAFSDYLLHLDRGDFSIDCSALAYSSHPITWLRIKFLVSRARRLGYPEMATELESHWESVADSLCILEDYFGYFETEWMSKIELVIDDMLTEASPCPCSKEDAVADREWVSGGSPALLLNRAWRTARNSPQSYAAWEPSAVSTFVR